MRGAQSLAVKVDDRRKASKRVGFYPRLCEGYKRFARRIKKNSRKRSVRGYISNSLVQGSVSGLFASWTMADVRLRVHCRVCLMLNVILQFFGCEGIA